MTTALIGRNTRVEVESTLDTSKTITAITKASPGVVTATAHGYSNGDYVVLDSIQGMTELDGQIVRIANITTNTFELEGIDTTNYGTFTSGGAKKISAWVTLGMARNVKAGSVSANRKEATVLLDSEKSYVVGASDVPEITIDGLSDPFSTAMVKIETAARAATNIGFRVTLSDSSKRLFRGMPSLPAEDIGLDNIITQQFSVTQTKRRLAFAT